MHSRPNLTNSLPAGRIDFSDRGETCISGSALPTGLRLTSSGYT
jgi:hypothetical protein